jgi:hypothetical protein
VEQGGGGAATALGGGLVSAVVVAMVLRGSMLGFGTMGKGGGDADEELRGIEEVRVGAAYTDSGQWHGRAGR